MIAFSQQAIDKVREFHSQTPEAAGKELRIFIQGIGCSGYTYGFTFDDQHDDDTRVEQDDFVVLVDPTSAPNLKGASVDFVNDTRGAGFTVDNPNKPVMEDCSSGGCSGCG
ncbi:MAG: iron-sulfur cluster assembly accessory protein [bacterium]|nr:iron-sulfur cluster assembly accessory protein [bacterium]